MNAITKSNTAAVTAERVLIRGDLAALSEDERIKYYADVCNSVGLNPLTKPFEYIQLNGKLRLYALKDCTDQLRSIHGISVVDIAESEREGVFVVKAKVSNAQGRTDMATGAVNIAGLKGEALANALMKAETKAKRRATLSICGLGLLDETEVDDIPSAQKANFRVPSPQEIEKKDDPSVPVELTPFKDEKFPAWADRFIASIHTAKSHTEVDLWCDLNRPYLDMIKEKAKAVDTKITKALTIKHASFQPKADPISTGPQKAKSSGPDIDADYEGWIKWAFEQINSIDDAGALQDFLVREIQAQEATLFPPDFADLVDCYTRRQTILNSDGE